MLTGPAFCRLMRRYRCTLRALHERTGIPLTHIRARRKGGFPGHPYAALDYVQAVTRRPVTLPLYHHDRPSLVWDIVESLCSAPVEE